MKTLANNSFWGFVLKEIRHIIRDTRTIAVLFALPIVLVLLFGYVLNNDFKNIQIAVLDQAQDDYSQKLINKIFSSGYFVDGGRVQAVQEIESVFRRGKIKMVVVFPPSFTNDVTHKRSADVQLVIDATEINTATNLANYTSGIIQSFAQELQQQSQPVIRIEPRMIFNERLLAVYLFIPGVITLVMTIVSAMLTAVTLAREKEFGTMELLTISPIRPIAIVMGKVLPYLFISFANSAIILLMGVFIFGLPMNGSILLLTIECLLFTVTALSLGIFISTRVDTQQAAMFGSIIMLMMPTMLLSGFIFPRESMPIFLQIISNVIPATHFIIIIKAVMIKGVGLEFIWKETLFLLGTAGFFFSISIFSISRRS